MTLEMTWVAPIEEAADYDPSFFQSIRDACTGCFSLLSLPNSVEPLSVSMRFKYVRQYLECADYLHTLPHPRYTRFFGFVFVTGERVLG